MVEFPYDTHRPAPLVGAIPGGPEEDIGLRDTVDLVELTDKEEDPAPAETITFTPHTARCLIVEKANSFSLSWQNYPLCLG